MRRTIATVSLSGTLHQKLEAVAAARFDGIELFEPDFIGYRGSAASLRALCADLGLGIDLLQPFRDFEGMPEDALRRGLDRAERKFDLMQQLGSPLLLVCSNVSPLALPEPERAAEQLRALAERAARRNLRIGFEALAWGRHVKRWRQAWRIVELADHPHLGLVLDSFHTLSLEDDAAGIAALPGERIFFLQMADAPRLRLDVIDWARHHRNFPGQGQLPVVDFFEQVVRAGYDGPLSLEIFNDVFRETPNRRIAVDAMRSLLWLESQVRERLAAADDEAARRALATRPLFAPPALPRFGGWSFVEFAVDAAGAAEASGAAGASGMADADALATLLGRMGFRLVGRHRSKPVMLYRQGAIHLVVNRGARTAADESLERHAVSVCALALRTADAALARNRAVALLSARFDPPVGPGERALPSVIAPGGLIVQFVPEALGEQGLFEADFLPVDDAPPVADAGLRAIDHVGLALAPDRVDTWVLFCRAVLGLEAGESLKLADPFGLLRSFGMADTARRLRLLLSVSQSTRTRLARAAGAGGGAVVQQIAFATDDVFASVRAMRAAGLRFVEVPGNYHDDLATRVELDDALLQRLRAHGVMFDRSEDGDFLHAGVEAGAGGIGFELVQRIGGYDGYGVANAPVRLAAQAQQDDHGVA